MDVFVLSPNHHAQGSKKRALQASCFPPDGPDDGPLPEKRTTRASIFQKDPAKCLLCQAIRYVKRKHTGSRVAEPLTSCSTHDIANSIMNAAEVRQDHELLIAIRGSDLVAMEIKYHGSCHRRYTDKQTLERIHAAPSASQALDPYDAAFHEMKKYINTELFQEMKVLRMTDLLTRYKELLSGGGFQSPNYRAEKLKRRMVKCFGRQLSFWHPHQRSESEMVFVTDVPKGQIVEAGVRSVESSFDEDACKHGDIQTELDEREEATILQHAALILRRALVQVQSTISQPLRPEDIEENSIPVPTLVYNMMACILHPDTVYQATERIPLPLAVHRQVLSISQDLIHVVSRGRVKTQKHVALPLLIKNLGGTSEIITVLNRLGHGLSYTQTEELETALAEEVARPDVLLPSSCQPGVFGTFCWDNSDLQEETLSGRGTTHCTSGIVIQQKVDTCSIGPSASPSKTDVNEDQGTKNSSRRPRTVPEKQVTIMSYPTVPRKGPDSFTLDTDQLTALIPENTAAQNKDFGWFLARLPTQDLQLFQSSEDYLQSIPGWTPFNRLLHENKAPRISTIGYCQSIDASPTEMATVYTMLKKSLAMADELHQFDCPVVCDLAIYAKVMQIIWQRPGEFARIVPCMGAFHITCSFLSTIGKRFGDAGLSDILTESGVLASGSVAGVLQGKHYNRALRMHKLMYEALERLRWYEFGRWLEDHPESQVSTTAILKIQQQVREQPCLETFEQLLSLESFSQLKEAYDAFSNSHDGPMKKFWGDYLQMTSLLLQFIRATREGNWSLHLACIGQMIPYMFALDNVNYARHLPVNDLEMT